MGGADEESPSSLSLAEARALFPALERVAYFATNAQGLLPTTARDRASAALERLCSRGFGGALELEAEVETVRAKLARLIGADPHEIGFVRNTGEGLCYAAEALPLSPGDEVLCFAGEYRSVVHAFQGAAPRGISVRVAPAEDGRVTAALLRSELRERTRAVALSWVRYDTGARADLASLSAVTRAAGTFLVVDAIQGLGALPLDVRSAGVDVLCAGAHKWLLGLPGTGVLYLSRELLPRLVPSHLGVGSMADATRAHLATDPYLPIPASGARRVEEGARNTLGIAALGASLDLLQRVGPTAIRDQIRRVTDRLCAGIIAAGGRVRSPRGGEEWSGIVLLEPPPGVDAAALAGRMLRERIAIGAREGALWAGAQFYTTQQDADRVLALL
ncbi:MAG: aminotransferase class V-fold PLP-dependent enzyme [Deltaproteobacteria bacterium]|nr:aminotransferase class V-fold PLP-dependent enzyme [Deltaproteobacteria bacterium]